MSSTAPAAVETDALPALLYPCDKCGRGALLLAILNGEQVCVRCWRRMGCPFPRPCTAAEAHAAVIATQQRMNERGGADRHMVRSGKS